MYDHKYNSKSKLYFIECAINEYEKGLIELDFFLLLIRQILGQRRPSDEVMQWTEDNLQDYLLIQKGWIKLDNK